MVQLNLVDVMDNYVYNAFCNYFHTLETLGYASKKKTDSLIVLYFFYELMFQDYRGYVSKEDYHSVEKALNCLYGTNCLIPYPDYLKMGKLHVGEMTEVLSRIKVSEEVLEEFDKRILDNDALIADNTKRIDEHGTRLDQHRSELDTHESRLNGIDVRLGGHDVTIADHEDRITAIEDTKVVKGKNLIQSIPDIDLSNI